MTPLAKLYEMKMMRLADSREGNPRFVDMWIIAEKRIMY